MKLLKQIIKWTLRGLFGAFLVCLAMLEGLAIYGNAPMIYERPLGFFSAVGTAILAIGLMVGAVMAYEWAKE